MTGSPGFLPIITFCQSRSVRANNICSSSSSSIIFSNRRHVRSALYSFHKGDRRIRAGELIKLAHAYGLQLNDFAHAHVTTALSQPQFRGPLLRTEEDNAAIAPAVEKLKLLARDYFELEKITETPLMRKYPSEYDIKGLRPHEAAEHVALEERMRLGLGDGQVLMLRDILEQDVGLRIFYYPLPSKFSAIYLYDEQIGGCIAVNSHHPEERGRWSLAHDYGHFLVHRQKPIAIIDDYYQRKPESERFADNFALYFLMPTTGVIRRFNDIRRVKEKVTLADLCVLAHYYGVSMEAMALRLEGLKLLATGTWDLLKAGGVRVRDIQKQLGLEPSSTGEQMLPIRYQHLAIEAFEQGLMSEGMLSRFLDVDRLKTQDIIELFRHTRRDTEDADFPPSDVVHPPSS